MSLFAMWGIGALVVLAYMAIIWIASVIQTNASIVDIFWGPGFAVLAVAYFVLSEDGFTARKVIITALVIVWGLRLGTHIFVRNRGKGEDFRYQNFRQTYGPERYWWVSFFQVFLLQGALMWLISAPLLAAQHSDTPDHLTPLDGVGALVWGIGFFFEAVGDWQLTQFKKDPANKGQVLQSGLWRYTRHPNYFGDATLWWGYYLIALGAGGWWTIFSPAIMTLLLMRVSGVALLEKTLVETRPQYRDYIQRTSAFFPWFPKKP